MNDELKNLIENTSNREGLARVFDHVAERFDEIIAERRRASPDRRKVDDGGTDGR